MRDRVRTCCALILALVAGCGDEPALTSPEVREYDAVVAADVEAMISGALAGWWRAGHGPTPAAALSTAADAHTSSWRNWGMLDAGAEPRQPLNTDPSYRYNLILDPWTELNRTLASVRDAMIALDAGVVLGEDDAETRRARVFGALLQGLALGHLAQLFDRAFIVDENTDLATVELSPYADVGRAALAKLGRAVELAADGPDFIVPADWVGFERDLTRDQVMRLARSFRARYAISFARTPAERAAVDWADVLQDARGGIERDWGGYYDGDYETNWAWGMEKLYTAAHPMWARLDYRTIGPADASGQYRVWISSPPSQRVPFLIDTDDRRITGGSPTADGIYAGYEATTIFRPERGRDHFSYYVDRRWAHLLESEGVGRYPDFAVKELAFIEAEALYRLGDRPGAMALVNGWRRDAGLPALGSPGAMVPGGSRCVPRRADGSCGDLWDALVYEKRIELFHYGAFTEFTDDRGWGDLVPGTFRELPAPDDDFRTLLASLYGTPGAADLAADVSASGLRQKREAYDAFDRSRNRNPGDVAGS